MTTYLFDAGPISALLRNCPVASQLLIPLMRMGEVATSTIVYGEVMEYVHGFADYQLRRAGLRRLLRDVPVIAPGKQIMERYALLRRALRSPYGPGLIGDMDTVIAATVLVRNLTLVTMDGDFGRVPGLQLMLLPRHT